MDRPLAEDSHEYSGWIPLIDGKTAYSYEQLAVEAAHITRNLRGVVHQKFDKVGVLLPNSGRYVALLGGMLHAEVTVCLCSTRLPIPQIREQLDYIGCRYLVTDMVMPGDLPGINVLDPNRLFDRTSARAGEIDMRFATAPTILFTSGSTGKPKAVQISVAHLTNNVTGAALNMPFGKGDRWLLSLPLYHIGGYSILLRSLWGTGTVVIPENNLTLLQAIEKYSITHISVVPTQLARLVAEMKTRGASPPRLKAVLVGGSAVPFDLIRQAVELGLPLFTSYGLTEMGSQVTTTAPDDSLDRLKTSGRLLRNRAMKIADDGEILVCGPTLFDGYVGPEGLHLPLDNHGWFHTGDMGRLDEDEYLIVTGRKDNMFISGGENIHPEEIELLIKQFSGIEEAIVVPIKSAQWGERPVAFVKTKEDRSLDTTRLADFILSQLPKFKLPDHFLPWPEDSPPGLKPNRPHFRALAEKFLTP